MSETDTDTDGPRYRAVVDRLRTFVMQHPRHRQRIAEDAGISHGALRNVAMPDWRPAGAVIIALERMIDSGWTPPPTKRNPPRNT